MVHPLEDLKPMWNEDKTYDYYYWIDAGLSYDGLIHRKYLNSSHNARSSYECNLFNNLFLENLTEYTNDKFLFLGKENKRFYSSQTVDPKWYTTYSNHIHVIGGLFGGHRDKWDNVVNIFENYVANILSDSIAVLHHEEKIMSLMYYNHIDLFVIKHFDIWWPSKNIAPQGISDEWFVKYKSFYRILEEFNKIEPSHAP